uniref:Uncharacterized protein n=1 Tax=Timema shepardi TaxID=629360 RepID=A0A7R9AUJ8_TIMSH|nr:unnamed protein product [Timema shepardi]
MKELKITAITNIGGNLQLAGCSDPVHKHTYAPSSLVIVKYLISSDQPAILPLGVGVRHVRVRRGVPGMRREGRRRLLVAPTHHGSRARARYEVRGRRRAHDMLVG